MGVDGGYVVSVKYNAIIKIPSKGQAKGYMHVSCGGGGYTYECAKAGDFNVRKNMQKAGADINQVSSVLCKTIPQG